MKIEEVRNMTDAEVHAKLADFRTELMNLRFQRTVGKAENPMRMRKVRRTIARILTILKERAA
jgi:large subunit ribosomal protein L29